MGLVRSAGRFFFGKLLPKLPYPVLKGPLKGSRFILGTHGGQGGGATVYFNMVEPKQTESFVHALKPGGVLFDVGANVGYYTVLGSRLVGNKGKVVSFEPFIRNISYLYRHVSLNKLRNVIIVPTACADRLNIVSFHTSSNTAMGHIEGSEADAGATGNTDVLLVATVSLDDVAEKLGQLPNVVKIDVEGAELSVLEGARSIVLPNKPVIFLSVHSDDLRDKCLQLLKTFQYEFEPLDHSDMEKAMEYLCKSTSV